MKLAHLPGFLLAGFLTFSVNGQARIQLKDTTLMHQMRTTPSPLDKSEVSDRMVSLMWPLPAEINGPADPLDGVERKERKADKTQLCYQVRYAQDAGLKKDVITITRKWPFYNPEKPLKPGTWYWQYGYVNNGQTEWSPVLQFTVTDAADKFCPPSLNTLLKKLPAEHPRIWVDRKDWENFRKQSSASTECQWYIKQAEKVLKIPMQTLKDIKTERLEGLKEEVKRQAMLIRESRRIVDREEANTEVLIRSYLLTADKKYYREAIKRIEEMASWKDSKLIAGDFNAATMLSLCSMAFDSFHDLLTQAQKQMLLNEIRHYGTDFYNRFSNHLENHIADNHTWQMTFRIFTFATFSVYGELAEAGTWADYCYNLWLVRFPGLNKDSGWHNGDSYFHVNIRTLVEVPYFYSRITGFDFFTDPWYKGSVMYTIFAQPPFSHASGNGSSHLNIEFPSGTRVGYVDALARLTGNTYAADYVRRIQNNQPDILKKAFMAKPGDLSWFRLQCHKPLPQGKGLNELPLGYVFPQTGLASFQSDWSGIHNNAMLTFRSSPYGSTSHALANQNAFNTYFEGLPLFYSSGHHIAFTDEHSVYCHRSTRGHNTILVNGMGQRIGTEGYGWIPRHYTGKKINYVAGDASNAYGKVISPLWIERGEISSLEYSPVNGWDENHLKNFRRHIVTLSGANLTFIYDELEADTAVNWNYLLHTIAEPMAITENEDWVNIRATNGPGTSDAYLLASEKLQTGQTDQFFYPAVNWLRADDNGKFKQLENHWHFTATSSKQKVYRFVTIISTHSKEAQGIVPQKFADGQIRAGEWIINANISTQGEPSFSIRHTQDDTFIIYNNTTHIKENGRETVLTDEIPELEI